MPQYKPVQSLYHLCIKEACMIVFRFCKNLHQSDIQYKSSILNTVNIYLCSNIPTSILDDLLEYHTKFEFADPIVTYFFYKSILHPNIKKFRAKNMQLNLSYWECIFKTSFYNLVELNLALSCTNDILRLISIYCPNLEYLNATCKYERLMIGYNATAFFLSVTDQGIECLWQCKKLKVVTLNEPRSGRNGTRNGITYAGLRNLLLNVPTIEDITYTDLGSVIATGMDHIDLLNLRIIRHFNATEATIKEIIRLCVNLEELQLTFFNTENHSVIVKEIINSNLNLLSLGLNNFFFNTSFDSFFEKLGKNLMYLSLQNCIKTINIQNILTIGKYCPNLKFLKLNLIENNRDNIYLDKNIIRKNSNYFSKLEDLYLTGNEMDLENLLIIFTQNAVNLENLKLTECSTIKNCDDIFIKYLNNENLKYIELSSNFKFTEKGIRKLIDKFKKLRYLTVFCSDDCNELRNDIYNENYDLTFINHKSKFFNDM